MLSSYIRLVQGKAPSFLEKVLVCEGNPVDILRGSEIDVEEYSRATSTFRLGNTSKTTKPGRHRLSDAVLVRLLNGDLHKVVLDVGASDGSTSLDLMNALQWRFKYYYVTDLKLFVKVKKVGEWFIFEDPDNGKTLLVTNQRVIIRSKALGLIKTLFPMVKCKSQIDTVMLVIPQIQLLVNKSESKVSVRQFDLMEKWPCTKPDVIKAANILNPVYFSNELLLHGLNNIIDILIPGGLFVWVHNTTKERATIVRKLTQTEIRIEERVNGGVMPENLLSRTEFSLVADERRR